MTEYKYKKALKSLFVLIAKQSAAKRTLSETARMLKAKIGQFENINKFEKAHIYSACYDVARIGKHNGWEQRFATNKVFDNMYKTCRAVSSAARLRKRKAVLREELSNGETIFFLCSTHHKPAPDHEAYQGKIYVDRYWRGKIGGGQYRAVLSYIKNHSVGTVQNIVGEPIYLTTRPYCKHYFIPIETDTVLGSSVRSLQNRYNRTRTVEEYRQEYYAVRTAVYSEMNRIVPCEEFAKKATDKR